MCALLAPSMLAGTLWEVDVGALLAEGILIVEDGQIKPNPSKEDVHD